MLKIENNFLGKILEIVFEIEMIISVSQWVQFHVQPPILVKTKIVRMIFGVCLFQNFFFAECDDWRNSI